VKELAGSGRVSCLDRTLPGFSGLKQVAFHNALRAQICVPTQMRLAVANYVSNDRTDLAVRGLGTAYFGV
jgi:hypothetical protein